MSTPHVDVRISDGVLEMTISRPERRNALTYEMYDALASGIERGRGSSDVRVLVIRGRGGVFTSGNDLADFASRRSLTEESPGRRFLESLIRCEKPLVAAVDGAAIGIGATMLLHCDLVYAAESAFLQFPFVSLGLVPEAASSLLLPRLLGHARAADLVYFGDRVDARRARELGLVSDVVPDALLGAHVAERVRRLATRAPASLRHTKRLLRGDPEVLLAHMREETAIFKERLGSPEAAEAIAAFFAKREPDFEPFR